MDAQRLATECSVAMRGCNVDGALCAVNLPLTLFCMMLSGARDPRIESELGHAALLSTPPPSAPAGAAAGEEPALRRRRSPLPSLFTPPHDDPNADGERFVHLTSHCIRLLTSGTVDASLL